MTVIRHPLDSNDQVLMREFRAAMASAPKFELTPDARSAFDGLMGQVPPAPSISHEPACVAGVAGHWCRTAEPRGTSAILYLHGGGFVLGSSAAYRNFASQVAHRAGVDAFVPDYRLAPEHPFPSAVVDILQVYDGLVALGYRRIALVGDSAGGGLALSALSQLCQLADDARIPPPVGAAAMSPWTDLTLSGDSMATRASSDPLLSRETLAAAADLYLKPFATTEGARVSALHTVTTGLPPVRLHVGADEVLLDDSIRYAAALRAAGGIADVHVWEGMTHVFPSNLALAAARGALDDIGRFLRLKLALRDR